MNGLVKSFSRDRSLHQVKSAWSAAIVAEEWWKQWEGATSQAQLQLTLINIFMVPRKSLRILIRIELVPAGMLEAALQVSGQPALASKEATR
jgi:hypothetical protein